MLLKEAIGSLQAVTCVYENQLVIQYYDLAGFALVVFILLNVHRYTNRSCVLSPAALCEQYLVGRISIFDVFAVLAAGILGGTFAYRLAGIVWQLGFSDHQLSHYETFQCFLAYKTPLVMVALYEFVAVFLIRFLIGYVSTYNQRFSRYITFLSISLFLAIGISFVGPVALNPLIAYGRFGGCKGISNTEHFITYWFAPIFGWIAGWQIYKRSDRMQQRHLKKQ